MSDQKSPSFLEKLNHKLRESLTIRLITIGVLLLLLLIPLNMVQHLISERNTRSQNTISEVSSEWSKAQRIAGPVLTIPYNSYERVSENGKDGSLTLVERYLQLMPEELEITGVLNPEKLHRGIYDVMVYESELMVKGTFNLADLQQLNIKTDKINWEGTVFNFGLSDMRGITDDVTLNFGSEKLRCDPGLVHNSFASGGVHASVNVLPDSGVFKFSFPLKLKGSSELTFLPLAQTTKVALQSSWSSPSFNGAFLPSDRDVSQKGFTANWKVLDLNRPIPQVVSGSNPNFAQFEFGVELFMPATQYLKSERTAKYGALVIGLVFLIIFFIQIMRKLSIHPFQYILIGLALVLFYTLLVSISEFTSFNSAYLISGGSVVLLVSFYLHGVVANWRSTGVIFMLQSLIYGFIYVIIQLEDTALLIGSIGLFAALAVVMLASRKIDWYNLKAKQST